MTPIIVHENSILSSYRTLGVRNRQITFLFCNKTYVVGSVVRLLDFHNRSSKIIV